MTHLHRVGILLTVLTFTLIVWGGHVNSTNSGMAFSDWPTSNTSAMITYTPSEWLWQGDRFWEHGHRLLATIVGIVTTIMLVIAYRATPRERRPNGIIIAFAAFVFATVASALVGVNPMSGGFMESFMITLAIAFAYFLYRSAKTLGQVRILWLSLAAFTSVCLQGAFGGYTVRNNLPWWTSTVHGVLAEVFFMIVIGITFLTVRRQGARNTDNERLKPTPTLKVIIFTTWGFSFIQFILGALTRHNHAWSASLSWPQWNSEGFFPSSDLLQHPQVLIHFFHRTFAYAVALMMAVQWAAMRRAVKSGKTLPKNAERISFVGCVLVIAQIALGVLVLQTLRNEVVTTLHVMIGVALLAMNTVLMYTVGGKHQPEAEAVHQAMLVGGGRR
ncbi:MAG: COX15/CtaA family protein [Ignavibacteria bacterium]|nr:COX15/CtaA family protein [Ignavibacteria bacterium]